MSSWVTLIALALLMLSISQVYAGYLAYLDAGEPKLLRTEETKGIILDFTNVKTWEDCAELSKCAYDKIPWSNEGISEKTIVFKMNYLDASIEVSL